MAKGTSAARATPTRVDVRLEIAANFLSAKKAGEAYSILSEIKKVGPDDAARLFTLLAYAQLGMGSPEAAAKNIEQGVKYAKSEFDKDELSRLREYADQAVRQKSTIGRYSGQANPQRWRYSVSLRNAGSSMVPLP